MFAKAKLYLLALIGAVMGLFVVWSKGKSAGKAEVIQVSREKADEVKGNALDAVIEGQKREQQIRKESQTESDTARNFFE